MRRGHQWQDGTGVLWVPGNEALPLEIAASRGTRRRGLLGRPGIDGALLITRCSGVHTFQMQFTIDVAYLDGDLRVVDVHTLKPGRLGRPRLRARHVLEADGGSMAAWGVSKGVHLRVDGSD